MTRTIAVLSLTLLASPALAQNAPSRGWVDINLVSVGSQQDEQTYTFSTPVFDEVATAATVYPKLSSGRRGDIAAGVNVHPRIGVGVHFDLINYDSEVGMALRVPHPLFFNRFAEDARVTDSPLERRDRAVDIAAVFTVPTPDAWRVRLFGGPTYFSVSQEMVEDIGFNQLFDIFGLNLVEIDTFTRRTVDGTAWGFNAGADVSYFFSRNVGVGAVVRFNRGTVTVDEPLTGNSADLEAGHTTVGAGLRLRF
jgi:hypothetical protein